MSRQVTRIGKYEIVEQIGEGAMGVVYRALDPVLNRPVAVKVMNEGLAQDEALRQRFLREAQAAGSLQHPNVVTIYDFGETEGHLFIAMEYIEGTDLEALLARDAEMPLAARLDLIIDVLNGLAYAHRRGIVHRDIKPANIRIDAEGHARIMDFGVVHLSSSNLTNTGVMMGTPNYMAPEQITEGEVTSATDLFSVGAVLYELLTGAKPFQADTLHKVLFRIVSDPPPDVRALAPDLPQALDAIVKKALAKDPTQRYQRANDMANDLSALRAALGAPRASRTVSQRSSIEKALLSQRQAESSRDIRRWKTISAVAAALVVVAVAGTLFAVLRERGARDAETGGPVVVAGAPSGQSADSSAPLPGTTPPATAAGLSQQPPATQAAPLPGPPASPGVKPRQVSRMAAQAAPPSPPTAAKAEPRQATAARDSATVRDTTAARDVTAARDGSPASDSQAKAPPAPVMPSVSAPASPAGSTTASASGGTTSARDTEPRAPAPPENPREAIAGIVAAYARAIGTRDVAQLRAIYPAMTADQQSAWASFFSSVRTITATLELGGVETRGTGAVARVTGVYEFVTRAGRSDRQPASFEAVFQRDADRWKLAAVR